MREELDYFVQWEHESKLVHHVHRYERYPFLNKSLRIVDLLICEVEEHTFIENETIVIVQRLFVMESYKEAYCWFHQVELHLLCAH